MGLVFQDVVHRRIAGLLSEADVQKRENFPKFFSET